MSQQNEGLKGFIAGEALEAYRRVKLAPGLGDTVVYADQADSDNYIGVTQDSVKVGEHITVRLKTRSKTFKIEASDSFAVQADLYAADDGKVSDSASGNKIATALEAASSGGEIIEMLPV